jgi:hypothetical protein
VKQYFINGIRWLLHCSKLLIGVVTFKFTKKTPAFAYHSLIGLFCLSGGWTNTLLAKFLAGKPFPIDFNGILSNSTEHSRQSIREALRTRGLVILPGLIPGETCDAILSHILACSGKYSGDGVQTQETTEQYDRNSPRGTKFTVDTKQMLTEEKLQSLLCDESLLAAAQDYLGGAPIIDIATAWWSAESFGKPDAEAAQFFHFDMDRTRWLKVFVYLTDVTSTSGPHVFIPGTHRDGGIPAELLSRGYARLTDDDVARHFPPESWVEATGPKGTVILEDTRGLHKGKPVASGDRLIFQIEYTVSLFGGHVTPIRFADTGSGALSRFVQARRSVAEVIRDPLRKT